MSWKVIGCRGDTVNAVFLNDLVKPPFKCLVYSHRFVLLSTFVKGSCSVLRGNGECRNTLPWLFKVLRISNCWVLNLTQSISITSPPFPRLREHCQKKWKSWRTGRSIRNAAFSGHNMAATHMNSEKRWLPTYYRHNIKPGKNLIMQWGGATTLLAAGGGKFTGVFVLSCFVFRNVATGRLFEL